MNDGATEYRNTRDACPACLSGVVETAFERDTWSAQFINPSDARKVFSDLMSGDPALRFDKMLRCTACGTVFTDAVPGGSALSGFYAKYYGNDPTTTKLERKLALETRRIFFLKWLASGRRFLDVGCNIGCAVEAARRNGFTSFGVDLNLRAIEFARGRFPHNAFVHGSLESAKLTPPADLVYCAEVLEHVPDVPAFIRLLANQVSHGGTLFLTTPNAGHPRVRYKLMSWDQVKPPEHLTLFTKAGLSEALAPYFRSIHYWPNLKPGLQVVARRR